MKNLFGVLTVVTFAITIASYSTIGRPVAVKGSEVSPYSDSYAEQDTSWFWQKKKAVALVGVGWEGCSHCERFKKETVPPLLEEGYDASYCLEDDWDGPEISAGPTLFYLDEAGNIVRTHKGFQTAKQVKRHLEKP